MQLTAQVLGSMHVTFVHISLARNSYTVQFNCREQMAGEGGGQAGITIDTVYVPRTKAALLQESDLWPEPGYAFLTFHSTMSLHLSVISSTSIIARTEFLDYDHETTVF